VELTANHAVTAKFSISATGQYLNGEDENDDALQDIAPHSIAVGMHYATSLWDNKIYYEHRFSKSDVAINEHSTDRAQLLSANITFSLGTKTTISFWGRNLLNDTYRISTDSLSTQGEERSFGINLAWQQQP